MVKITGDYKPPEPKQPASQVHPKDAARKYIPGLKPTVESQAPKGDAARKYITGEGNKGRDQALAALVALLAVVGIGAAIGNSYQSNGNRSSLLQADGTSTSEQQEPQAEPSSTPSSGKDPAVELAEGNYISTEPNPETPWLNSMDQYKRGAGDMARVQERLLRFRDNARRYPGVNLGYMYIPDDDGCGMDDTLGSYHLDCEAILINFKAQGMTYERPIDVLTVLAHEWGHHLTNMSWDLSEVSRLEQEMVADCFAGVMHGYWGKHGKLDRDEFERAGKLMIAISKRAEDIDDDHGDPGQRLGAFLGGAMKAAGKDSRQYQNFCQSMDNLFDWSRGLP